MDRHLLDEAAIVASWAILPSDDVDDCERWLREAMHGICDASMPRMGPFKPRRQTYWWRPELLHMQQECTVAKRRFKRYRRRRVRNQPEEDELYEAYRAACHALRDAILQAKTEAWQEWLRTLEEDPWGRPYKWVRQKLRPAALPITQTIRPELRRRVVMALFPSGVEWSPATTMAPLTEDSESDEEEEVPPVTSAELAVAVHRMNLKNTAPGLDGIPSRAWVAAMKYLEPQVIATLNNCLTQGRVPQRWKTGKLVLLRKEGKPDDQPSAYRPIVLLDEACKILERVLVARINRHLEDVGPDLSPNQYGFRRGRSTVNAVAHLSDIIKEETSRGGVVLAVSLDISNAFNSLPWGAIAAGLKHHGIPRYIRRAVKSYLSNRSVKYPTQDGWEEQEVVCGVPQGSALGPDLWDIGYDWVLRGAIIYGAELVCYADDTCAVIRARTQREAVIRATAAVAQTVHRIQALGLKVALNKTEAVMFHGPGKAPPPGLEIIVGGTRITVGSSMTYLGLVLDSRWTFREHFRHLTQRVTRSAGALASLLPNLGGPSLSCRRLYMEVVRSMCMYGAPIWADHLLPENRLALGRLQRTMATRAVRGYRTISKDAACLLAGSIPWDLDARALADVFWRCAEVRAGGGNPLPDAVRRWRDEAKGRAVDLWAERLREPLVSVALIEAMRPLLKEWLSRKYGALSFRQTQVLTGHGCFGRYLCEIVRRESDTRCHHCGDERDTAEHTVATCPSWIGQRAALTAAIGFDTSLPAIARAMLESVEKWNAVDAFAEEVIAAKEEAERRRERVALDPTRRPRRRRATNGRNVPPLPGSSGQR